MVFGMVPNVLRVRRAEEKVARFSSHGSVGIPKLIASDIPSLA